MRYKFRRFENQLSSFHKWNKLSNQNHCLALCVYFDGDWNLPQCSVKVHNNCKSKCITYILFLKLITIWCRRKLIERYWSVDCVTNGERKKENIESSKAITFLCLITIASAHMIEHIVEQQQPQQRRKKSRGCEKSRANGINAVVYGWKQESSRSLGKNSTWIYKWSVTQMTHECLFPVHTQRKVITWLKTDSWIVCLFAFVKWTVCKQCRTNTAQKCAILSAILIKQQQQHNEIT